MPAVREYEQKQKGEKYSQRMRERERRDWGTECDREREKNERDEETKRGNEDPSSRERGGGGDACTHDHPTYQVFEALTDTPSDENGVPLSALTVLLSSLQGETM